MVKVKMDAKSLGSLLQMFGKGIPKPTPEFKFHPSRKWQFDYAWPNQKVAVEIEGGTFKEGGGRHNRPMGHHKDCDKYNAAAMLGWRILKYTALHLRDDPHGVIDDIRKILAD